MRVAGRYRLDRRIGSGGMGVVWLATDEKLDRVVAVKELLTVVEPRLDPQGRTFEESRDRVEREARIAARLQHPNVISVYDVALHQGRPWLVMEYLPSRSLAELIAERGRLPAMEVAQIGWQAAAGLAAAHAVGVVHRDIKPANVLIATDGQVKITDFGVSRTADEVQLTRTGLIAGTPAYLAPEVARGQDPTMASDVFSLGATLYAAVEGEPPFGLSDNAYALLHAVARGQVRTPTEAGPLTVPLMRLLRAEPDERPTALTAQLKLTAVAAGAVAPVPAAMGRTPTGPPARPPLGATRLDLDPVPRPPQPGPLPPPLPRPRPQPTQRQGPSRLRRLRPALIALVLVGAVVAAAAALLLALRDTDGGQAASLPATSTAGQATPAAAAAVTFLQRYYGLLPGDVEAGFALLSPQAQRQSGGFEGYRDFYARMAAVEIVDGPRAVANQTVRATIRFEPKAGGRSDERYEFTVATGADGGLIIQTFRRL